MTPQLNPLAPIVDPQSGLPTQVFTVLMMQLTKKLSATVTYNPPNLGAGATTTTDVDLPNVDFLYEAGCAFSLDTQGIMLNANVKAGGAAGKVTVTLFNPTAGAINLASGTLSVWARLP